VKMSRSRVASRSVALVTAAIVGLGGLVGLAGTASASGSPPWEPVGGNDVGSLAFFNSAGQQITGGNLTDGPLAAFVQGTTTLRANDTKATLFAATPVNGVAPGQWSTEQISGSTAFPNPSAPESLGTSVLPVVTGAGTDLSLAGYIGDFPNTDTSPTDGYSGLYVLRVFTSAAGQSSTTSYDAADIQVSNVVTTGGVVTGGTWSVVFPALTPIGTSTTLGTSPPSPQPSGSSVNLTATVTPSAPGAVQFEYGTGTPTLIGSPVTVSNGTASTSTTALPVGTDSLHAVFVPSQFANYSGSTGDDSYTINAGASATTTTLQAPTPSGPVTFGTSVRLNATVTSGVAGTITGAVQFLSGAIPIGSPQTVSGGAAALTTTALPVGSPDSLTAVFTPTGNTYAGSTSTPVPYTVNQASTTTVLATPTPASPQFVGASVTLQATVTSGVSGTIAGTIQFKSGATAIGAPQTVTAGAASLTTTALPVGNPDSLTAVFTPSSGGNFATSTSAPDSYTINPLNATTTSLRATSPSSPVTFGTSVTLGATVTSDAEGTISGTVQFLSGSTPIGSPQTVSAGAASLVTTALPVGNPDSLTAVFTATAGNTFAGSTSSPFSYTVTQASTTTVLGTPTPASPQFVGTSVTLHATVSSLVSGTIAGTVQFKSGTTGIGSPQTLNAGSASLTTTGLPIGSPDSLTAVFTPTSGGNFATSTSDPVSYTVNALNATTTVLTAFPGSPQLAGTSVTLSASVTSGTPGTITGTVQFFTGSSAVGSPQTVTAGATSIATTALPVGTDSLSAVFTPTAGNGYASSTGTGSFTVESTVTTPPAPPAGATSSQSASSSSPSGSATAGVTGVTATGSGEGALTVATYSGNPAAGAVSGGTGVYYDVALSSGNQFGSVTITISDLGPGGQSLDWWNGSAWVPFSDQIYDATTNSVTTTVNATTSPTAAQLTGTPISPSTNPAPSRGYWEVASDGGVFSFGGAGFFGSAGSIHLNKPIVGLAATPDGEGYWLVASDGGVFSYGDATFYGSEGGQRLNQPIVGIASTPSGKGYWEVASDGGIFSFGDAAFYGSEGGKPLNKPIVGIAPTPTGNGYWEVASDGGIFSFGDAVFYGSTGSIHLNKPVVGLAATPSGHGYWLVASDGGIFNYGDAPFEGSTGSLSLVQPVAGIATTASGNGYWEVASDGGIFNYGDAGFFGSQGGKPLNKPVVGIAGA
jgi:hypothetical protein